MVTFVVRWSFYEHLVLLNVINPQFESPIIEFLIPENIALDTNIFLAALENKIWPMLCFNGHLGGHFPDGHCFFFIFLSFVFLGTFSIVIRTPN